MGKRFFAAMKPFDCKKIVTLGLLLGTAALSHASVDFKKEILPVLEAKCLNCHQAAREKDGKLVKPKADLRLDADWAILKGGESGHPAVTPKNPSKSYALEVVSLPKDDDMFMPPKGDPLTAEETAKLRAWIEEGADFGGWLGSNEGRPADAVAKMAAAPKERDHAALYKRLEQGLTPLEFKATKALTEKIGAQVQALGTQTPLVRVDFLTGVAKATDQQVAGLLVIRDHIAQLDLARTKISDAALKSVSQMSRLVRLDVRNTEVSDAGLADLVECKELQSINLFGTKVTDAGMVQLAKMKSLREVYLTETQVTSAGVEKLRASLPEAEVVGSLDLPQPPKRAGGEEGGKKKKKKD